MLCRKCQKELEDSVFRTRKARNGEPYIVKVCIFCERKQKGAAERKRYHNFSPEKRQSVFAKTKEYSKKESYLAWHRKWQKEKELTDPKYLIKRRMAALVRSKIKKNGVGVFEVLGYTAEDLKRHLEGLFEPWMSWDNWGVYNAAAWDDNDPSTWTWQIDHVIPVNAFEYESYEDEGFKLCWALENLRPLSAKENILKGRHCLV